MQKAVRQRKRTRAKHVAVAVAIIAVAAIVIAASAIMLILPGQSSRPKASEYLRVVHSKSLGEFAEVDASVVYIKTLGIDITAVGGNASSILIDIDALVPQGEGDYNYYDLLPQGETWSAALPMSNMYLELDPSTGTYTFEARVSVHEAESEIFTFHISPDDILSSTQRKLTILPSTNGTTTPASGTYWYNSGTNRTLSAIPNSGFVFDYWIINSQNITTNPYALTITEITTVEARFKTQP